MSLVSTMCLYFTFLDCKIWGNACTALNTMPDMYQIFTSSSLWEPIIITTRTTPTFTLRPRLTMKNETQY